MSEVEFFYKGNNIKIQCNSNEKIRNILYRFISKVEANNILLVYIYNGYIISNEELTFYELANSEDKKRNKMNIVVTESSNSNYNQFIYEKCVNADNSMKEFAEMSILYALQKYPDNDYQKCEFVSIKFEEKYGGNWGASFLKNGDSCYVYRKYYIKVKYGDYTIKILKTDN